MSTALWERLFVFDTTTLIGIMFWEGIASSLIIYTSWKRIRLLQKETLPKQSILFHLIRSLGYFLLVYRGLLPDVFSSTLANILLYLSFYLDTQIILQASGLDTPFLKRYGQVVFTISSVAYVLMDVFSGQPNLRTVCASLTIFLTFAPVVIRCMFGKGREWLTRAFLSPYALLTVVAFFRAIRGMTDNGFGLLESNGLQSLFYSSLMLKAFFGTLFLFDTLLSKSSEEIDRVARDPLTGMINRQVFFEQSDTLLARRRVEGGLLGMFFLDIDRFKRINDNWGHDKGDEVIIAVANAVQSSINSADICCRYGGDEFSICVALDKIELGNEIAKRMQKRLSMIDIIEGETITSSMGLAFGIPTVGETIDDYVKRADEAMYCSKQNGRNRLTALAMNR